MVKAYPINPPQQEFDRGEGATTRPDEARRESPNKTNRIRNTKRKVHLSQGGDDRGEAAGLETCRCDHVGRIERSYSSRNVTNQKAIGQASNYGQSNSCANQGNANTAVCFTTHPANEDSPRSKGKHYAKGKSVRAQVDQTELTIAALQKAFAILNEATEKLTLERARCIYESSALIVEITLHDFKDTHLR